MKPPAFESVHEAVLTVRPTIIVWAELEDHPVRKAAFERILAEYPDPVALP